MSSRNRDAVMSVAPSLATAATADRCGTTVAPLTRLLAIGQLALVAATWRLWTPQTAFPQVPLIRAACDWPGWLDWVCLVVLIGASVAMLAVGRRGRASRAASASMALSLAMFFLLDQHRLQPWAWQFGLLAVLLTLADDATVRRGWIWLAISIYAWSAFSKLDYTFFHEQGPGLLRGLKQAIGLRGIPNRWTEMLDLAGAVGLAGGEMVVAMLLAWPRTRRVGLWLATLMHLTLLAALGPFGLRHSHGVLLWNVFFIAQDWLLFLEPQAAVVAQPSAARCGRKSALNRCTLAVILAAVIWPILEPIGYCDHWLAWAVYSGRPEKSLFFADAASNLARLPAPIGGPMPQSWKLGASTRYVWLDITGWSLSRLGVPTYPQQRFQVGVALSLVEHDGLTGGLILTGATSRWTGTPQSQSVILVDPSRPDELNVVAESFFWNAHPRRSQHPRGDVPTATRM